jgi:D-apiose dehydrogenase
MPRSRQLRSRNCGACSASDAAAEGGLVSRRLRGVAIGAGYFAPFQLEAWTRIPEVEITALCDVVEHKARSAMAQYGVPAYYADWREMIDAEQPDFVDIITPPATHAEMCAYAASRAVHIICQKPLAPTLDEGRHIVEAADLAGVRFMVHENFRWQPWYRTIKRLQGERVIGDFTHLHFMMRTGDGWGEDAYRARQPFFREYPRLLVYETGVHFIDTFRYLLGEVTRVHAHLRRLNPVIRGEDAGQLFLTFASGATAIWDANRYNEVEAASPRFTFGHLRIDATGGHLTMDTESNLRIKPLGQRGREVEYAREDRSFAGDCVYALQQHFVSCLHSNMPFESNGRDYLRTMEVVEAAYASAASGDTVWLG